MLSGVTMNGRRKATRVGRAFRILLSALITSPAGLVIHSQSARSQVTDSSNSFPQWGWFADPNSKNVTPATPTPTNVFQVQATIHDEVATCLGERLHVFSATFSGNEIVVGGLTQRISGLNEAAKVVCYSDLYGKLSVVQQARVIQLIKLANACSQDAESALADGDSRTGIAKLGSEVGAFQVAGETLVHGADRYLTLSSSSQEAKELFDRALHMLGAPGRAAIVAKGLVETVVARHLVTELLQEIAEEGLIEGTFEESDLDGRVAGALAKAYDQMADRQSGGFLRTYACP